MSEFLDQAKALLSEHKYFQLSASWCPDCVYTDKIFAKYNVKSVYLYEIDKQIKNQTDALKMRDAFAELAGGVRNLPTVFVNGKKWITEHDLHAWEKKGTTKEEFAKVGLL